MTTYTIIRFYQDPLKLNETIQTGLTLDEAQDWTNDPETSSRTARSESAAARTALYGPWFDGYTEE